MAFAVFMNGIYESVLEEIAVSQEQHPSDEHYLQPYTKKRIRKLHDQRPTPQQPVRLYVSTTDSLNTVSYVADIVDWKDKRGINEREWLELDRRIKERQPNEEGMNTGGRRGSGPPSANLIAIRDLHKLAKPFPITELILEVAGRPPGERTTSGGHCYVLLHDSDLDIVTQEDIASAQADIDERSEFTIGNIRDERSRKAGCIVQRRGQSTFRSQLLRVYNGVCAITGCDAADALEACHIHPYIGASSNDIRNGVLLRSDVHTLFDMGLIGIDPESSTVVVAPRLRDTSYKELHGRLARLPEDPQLRPIDMLSDRLKRLRQD
jgi:hypothetical protein